MDYCPRIDRRSVESSVSACLAVVNDIHFSSAPEVKRGYFPDRTSYMVRGMLRETWADLGLPKEALASIRLPGEDRPGPAVPSSFKIGILAQGAIGLSALAVAQFHTLRNETSVPSVMVPMLHAVAEFYSERLYALNGKSPLLRIGTVGRLHKTSDGYVRVHEGFPNHANGIRELAGLPADSSREELGKKLADWASIDLENVATGERKLAVYALRSYSQ